MDFTITIMQLAHYERNRPFLMEGFRRILGSKFDQHTEKAYDSRIESGATTVFIVGDGSPYPFGFFTVDFFKEDGEVIADISHGFNSGFIADNLLEECLAKAIEYARLVDAKKVVFSSERNGWLRRAKSLGAAFVGTRFEVTL